MLIFTSPVIKLKLNLTPEIRGYELIFQLLDISFYSFVVRSGLIDRKEAGRMRHFRNFGTQKVCGGTCVEEVRLDLVPVFIGMQCD